MHRMQFMRIWDDTLAVQCLWAGAQFTAIRQNNNTKSTTESEVVGVSEYLPYDIC